MFCYSVGFGLAFNLDPYLLIVIIYVDYCAIEIIYSLITFYKDRPFIVFGGLKHQLSDVFPAP